MSLKISKGRQKTAAKVVIYGPEGIGKSTLASKLPKPLFLDIESGTSQLDVDRVDEKIDTWEKLNSILDEIKTEPRIARTIVIDTADAAETLCMEYICKKHRIKGIEDLGYGKGYTYLTEEMNKFLKKLTFLNEEFRLNVVLLAHSMMRKFEEPDKTGAYDRFELKLQKKTAPLVKEWCDVLLFLNYKTFIVTSKEGMSESKKATGGERVMYTTHHPAWDAKNRYGLAEELPLDYKSIEQVFELDVPDEKLEAEMRDFSLLDDDDPEPTFEDEPEPKPEPKQESKKEKIDEDFTEIRFDGVPTELVELMKKDGITDEQVINACIKSGLVDEYNEKENRKIQLGDLSVDFVNDFLIARWEGFKNFVKANA